MEIEAKLEFSQIPSKEKEAENSLLIRLKTTSQASTKKRQPLVIGLAIDKSWSMKDEKIEATLEAAASFVNWLTRMDYVAVVAYSNDVQVVSALTALSEKISTVDKIKAIQVGTSTNLSGGWLQTLRMVESAEVNNAFKRVILLTDGNPTLGVKDLEPLIQIAKDHKQRGITTTTVGFGEDFNEITLQEIATAGGGNFYYIDTPEKVSDIFFQEFGDIGSLYGQAVEIEVKTSKGTSITEVVNEYQYQISESFEKFSGDASIQSSQKCIIQTGDIRVDDIKSVVVNLKSNPGILDSSKPFLEIKASFYNVENDLKMETVSTTSTIETASAFTKPDPDVVVEKLILEVGKSMVRISTLITEGRTEEAKNLLNLIKSRLETNRHYSPYALDSLLQRVENLEMKLKAKAQTISKQFMAVGVALASKSNERLDLKGVAVHNDIFTYATQGDVDLYNCPEIKTEIEQYIYRGYRFGKFDLNKTSHLDSSGIGTIIQVAGWLRRRGGELVLYGLRDSVQKLFEITKLHHHLTVTNSEPEADALIQTIIQERNKEKL